MRRRAGPAAVAVFAAVLAALAAPAAALAQDAPICDDLPSLPPDADRCAFVHEHCDPEGVLPLLSVYYCHLRPLGLVPAVLGVAACALLLIALFKITGHAADEYFSSILAQISQDCGLPPRLGGVTLLALGNGAPDLSSSIAAVRSGNYPLALGALTGGSMFVGCVVAGRIVATAGGVRARAAQIRDILTQFIAVATVTIIIATGRMTYGAVAALLSLYVVYVVVVAVADFSKRAGVEWGDVGRSLRAKSAGLLAPLLQRNGELARSGSDAAAAARAAEPRSGVFSERGYVVENGGGLSPVEEEVILHAAAAESVAAAAAVVFGSSPGPTVTEVPVPSPGGLERASSAPGSEVELITTTPPTSQPRTPRGLSSPTPHASNHGFPHPPIRSTVSAPAAAALSHSGSGGSGGSGPTRRAHTHQQQQHGHLGYDELVHMPAQEYRLRALADMAAASSFFKRPPPGGSGGAASPGAGLDQLIESDEEEADALLGGRDEERGEYTPPQVAPLPPEAASLPPAPGFPLPPKPEEPQGPLGEALSMINSRLETAVHPAILALKATVPIVEATSYDRPWFLAAMHLSPLFICFYLNSVSLGALLIAAAAGTAAGLACRAATAPLGAAPPVWDLGTGYPLGAGLLALYGFAVAAMWIDVFASEIVGIIHFFGLLAGADPAVLGVTVLAWGNSLTDFVANTAMALRSQAGTSMAMTACFAGPLFNLLVGLGVGFWTYLADTGAQSTKVVFDPVVVVGCVFIMANCLGVSAAAAVSGRRLHGWFGWAMMGWYAAYMAVILLIVLR